MYAGELLAGGLRISRANEGFFTECLLCRACVEMCFSSVETDEIVLAMRRDSARVRGKSILHQYIFNHLLPDHRRLGRALRFASLGRTAGAIKLAQALDIFGWYGRRFQQLNQAVVELPQQSLRKGLAKRRGYGGNYFGGGPESIPPLAGQTTHGPEAKRRKAFLFIGCGINFMFPQVGEATVEVLQKLGYEVMISDNGCCGLPAYAHGAFKAALKLAKKNISLLSEPDTLIITDCSSCASFLKEYPALISAGGGNPALIQRAKDFSACVRDVTEVLREAAPVLASLTNKPSNIERVTFHDPCHLSRHQKLSSDAREALRSLKNVEFIEMKEAEMCCGGAGAFAFEHPDLSLRILERKMQNIRRTEADIVATTCPSCMLQLRNGLKLLSGNEDAAGNRKTDEQQRRVAHLVELFRA
jgi:glycolate oxidase iron-sulfur subunit